MKELGYIYKIENTVNGKVYVGQTKDPKKRWAAHKWAASSNKKKRNCNPLYEEMRNYGIDRFSFSLLEQCKDDEMNKKEVFWIKCLNSQDKKFGYNIWGGGRGNGVFVSRAVDQYDLQGNYVTTYQSQCDAAKAVGVHHTKIGCACNGTKRIKSCGGYMWRYHGDGPPTPYKRGNAAKPVIQCDLNGRPIRKYKSMKEAGIETGLRYQEISNCCHGLISSFGGYVWKLEKQVGDVS